MKLIFDKGEIRLVFAHVASLIVPARAPHLPDAYRQTPPGDLNGWSPEAVGLLLDEGRRSLDAVNARFEGIQRRAQYLLGISVAALGVHVGFVEHTLGNAGTFLVWAVSAILLLGALLVSFATFAATARLGSVDPVIFSCEQPASGEEASASLARAYTKAFRRSANATYVRFTLYRDAIWLLVLGVLGGALAWTLANTSS